MTLTPFEIWVMGGLLIGLFGIVGYLIKRYVIERNGEDNEIQPRRERRSGQQKVSIPTNGFWETLMEKIDLLGTDVNELKILQQVQAEKLLNVTEKIFDHKSRLDDHGKRIGKIEQEHAKNHG